MPQNYLSCDRDQPLLVPPDLRDWLDEDHLAWFVLESVAELDLADFYVSRSTPEPGRAGHCLTGGSPEPNQAPGATKGNR